MTHQALQHNIHLVSPAAPMDVILGTFCQFSFTLLIRRTTCTTLSHPQEELSNCTQVQGLLTVEES